MAKFTIISDLHLEFYATGTKVLNSIIPDNSILLIAGDFCQVLGTNGKLSDKFKNAINNLQMKFNRVYYVTGNHEYYKIKIFKLSSG